MDARNGRRARRSTKLFDEDRPAWAFVTRRILIGVGLVVLGLGWSILNATVWAPKGGRYPPVVAPHGPVATSVRTLDDMRVRPELLATNPSANAIDVRVAFHNDAASARPVAPRDIYLLAGGRRVVPAETDASPLRPTVLARGGHVEGVLRFAHALATGVTLVYAPSWDGGRSVRWRLYQ